MTTLDKSKFGSPVSHEVCVIYDPDTGQIVHTHEHITYPGGPKVTSGEVEAEGLAVLAHRLNADVSALSGLHVMHVDPKEYQQGSAYRIEVTSRRLVEIRKFPG